MLVGISQFKHIYASELQLSTRFLLHCQDRFLKLFKWGSENEVKKSVEKVFPKGFQMDPNSWQKSIKACSGGVSKGEEVWRRGGKRLGRIGRLADDGKR